MRIVIADDNVDAADTLGALLRIEAHEVFIAHDGLNALKLIEEHTPRAAFLDIGMPGIDGYEIARRVRAQGRSLLLVALTGWGQPHDIQRALAAGFDRHFVKPYDTRALQLLLDSVSEDDGT